MSKSEPGTVAGAGVDVAAGFRFQLPVQTVGGALIAFGVVVNCESVNIHVCLRWRAWLMHESTHGTADGSPRRSTKRRPE